MSKTYNKLNIKSINGELLINIRELHIKKIVKQMLENDAIPLEYINEKLRLNNLNNYSNPIIINDSSRFEYLFKIINKECTKGTALLITELSNN